MRSGALREFVTVLRQVQMGVTGMNEPILVWSNWLEDIACEVKSRRGREQFDPQSKQRFAEVVYHFRFRYEEIEGMDQTMRILFEGSQYHIRTILPDEYDRRDVVVECFLPDGQFGAAPLMIQITAAIPSAVVGSSFELPLESVGGAGGYTFSVADGALPAGITLDAGTGIVSGVPTLAGNYSVVFAVADVDGTMSKLPALEIVVAAL